MLRILRASGTVRFGIAIGLALIVLGFAELARAQTPNRVSVEDGTAFEGQPITFRVTLSQPANIFGVTVSYTTRNDPSAGLMATSGVDFIGGGGSVRIGDRENSATFEIETIEDSIVESDETFRVSISLVGNMGNLVLDRTEVIGRIGDDDSAEVSVVAEAPATEGDRVSFAVTTDNPVVEDLNLRWSTADGTAMAPGDYTQSSGTVTLRTGRTARFSVPTIDDALVEGDETFTATIAADSRFRPACPWGPTRRLARSSMTRPSRRQSRYEYPRGQLRCLYGEPNRGGDIRCGAELVDGGRHGDGSWRLQGRVERQVDNSRR